MKIYMQNTYTYYNNTPDIENQIEYLNYTGLSSSIDEASFHSYNNNPNNNGNKRKLLKGINKVENNQKINKTGVQRRKVSYYNKKYVYKIPYKLLYNQLDDFPKINERKLIKLLNEYYKDKLFIKALMAHFHLDLKQLLIKWSNKKKNMKRKINNNKSF
jgi:hypothetical protein